jgi:hypothetical protein
VKQVTTATVNKSNNMNMVPVRNKLTSNSLSAFIKTEQACHSKCSIYLLSAADKSSLLVNGGTTPNSLKGSLRCLSFLYKKMLKTNFFCLCITNFVI